MALGSAGCSDLLEQVPQAAPRSTAATTVTLAPGRGNQTATTPPPTAPPATTAPAAPTAPPATTAPPRASTTTTPVASPGAPGAGPTTTTVKAPPPTAPTPTAVAAAAVGPFGRADAVGTIDGVGVGADGAPLLAATPGLLAAQLAVAEGALHDPASPPDRLAFMAHLQQLVYRKVALNPDGDGAFMAALPTAYHDIASRHLAARRHFVSPYVASVDDLPAWTIVDPEPVDSLRAHYAEAEGAYGVPWTVLASMNLVESAMGRIRGLSSDGAQGPMQFLPGAWASYGAGTDVDSPRAAILAAARFLVANGWATDPANALYQWRGDWDYAAGVQAYADLLATDPVQYGAIYRWQVYYANNVGDIWLPTGYSSAVRRSTAAYLADHPMANP